MKTFRLIVEAVENAEKHHVTAFVRMSPPTAGHLKLLNKVHSVAAEHNATHSVVTSHTQDSDKNPLTAAQKIKHIKKLSPGTNVSASSPEHPNLLHHLSSLHSRGVTHLHMVAGSDRHKEFHNLISKYNGKKAPHGYFKFKSVTMHSAGERDPDAEGVEGVSGSSQREHVRNNDRDSFHKGSGLKNKKDSDKLFNDVKTGMKKTTNEETAMDINEAFENVIAEETVYPMMGEFAGTLLHSAVVTHMMHWATRSYAAHKALEMYYTGIPELIDTIVESYQGKFGLIGDMPMTFTTVSVDDALTYMDILKQFVETSRIMLPDDSEIQNEIDNVASLIDGVLYQIRFLS